MGIYDLIYSKKSISQKFILKSFDIFSIKYFGGTCVRVPLREGGKRDNSPIST